MLVINEPTRFACQFDNLLDVVRHLRDNPSRWGGVRKEGRDSWSGNATFAECCELAALGWEAGVKEMDAAMQHLSNDRVRTRKLGFAGETPDVPRAVAGDPMNMISRGHERRSKPSLTVVAAIGGTAGLTAQKMANYGAALVNVIDRIENSGTRVELLAHWGNRASLGHRSGQWGITWGVKRLEDPVDLSAMAFTLGHAGAMRKLGFAMMETYPTSIPGYGGTLETINRKLIVDCPEPALFINGVQGDRHNKTRTPEGALEYVEAQFAAAEEKEAA